MSHLVYLYIKKMKKMKIHIKELIDPTYASFLNELNYTTEFPVVVLFRSDCDDYGYRTTFTLKVYLDEKRIIEAGNVKIIRTGQTEGYTKIDESEFYNENKDFYSLGQDADYYKELYKLGRHIYDPLLTQLNDVAYDSHTFKNHKDDEGLKVSLMRFSGAKMALVEAERIFAAKAGKVSLKRPKDDFSFTITTKINKNSSLKANFKFPITSPLPGRVNVIIGNNGTGKTRLLSNIATILSGYGYSEISAALTETAGKVEGRRPAFKKIIVLSYSAFDSFAIPGKSDVEKEHLEYKDDIFGYVYCGLRSHLEGSSNSYRLKTHEEINIEFIKNMNSIVLTKKDEIFNKVMLPILNDISLINTPFGSEGFFNDDSNIISNFQLLSSGHKIIVKMISDLVVNMTDEYDSLVLIDEPETHLHPPLVASFLKALKICLESLNGCAIITTHSPVVLQETPSEFVNVLVNDDLSSKLVRPEIETFAENVSIITQEVFGLDDGYTDWHDTLKQIIDQNPGVNVNEKFFNNKLGFTARSYIASYMKSKG